MSEKLRVRSITQLDNEGHGLKCAHIA